MGLERGGKPSILYYFQTKCRMFCLLFHSAGVQPKSLKALLQKIDSNLVKIGKETFHEQGSSRVIYPWKSNK